jgi:hydroxymethylpyrimidine/phosphomethylpyrimidine kinase
LADRPRVLSIAGSDPSGGAGIQADLKTFHAFGVYGMAVITSLTAQNTCAVTGIHDVPPAFVASQIRTVFDDVRVDAIKTGMLKSSGIVEVVAAQLESNPPGNLIIDPVMVATSGDRLIDDNAVEALKSRLLPLATLVTPNRAEAEVLAGRPIGDTADAFAAGKTILQSGSTAVLIKGIEDGDDLVDLLVTGTDREEFRLPRIETGPTHGSGCTLSSALASCLALGDPLPSAVRRAKAFVWRAIEQGFPVGRGSLPLNHFASTTEGAS